MAAPAIGLLIGVLYRPVYNWRRPAQIVASLVTLYIAVVLFGLGVGLYDAYVRSIPNRIPSAVILQAVAAALSGVTFYIFVLWPLAFMNHRLLGRFAPGVGLDRRSREP